MKVNFLVAVLWVGLSSSQKPPEQLSNNIIPGEFIVVFDDSDGASGSPIQQQKFQQWAENSSINISKRRNLVAQGVFNGMNIKIDEERIGDLSKAPGVKYITRNYLVKTAAPAGVTYPLPKDFTYTPHEMTGVDKAQKKLNLTGAGIKIGIIDTGVDYKHPGLGGCFGSAKCRIQFGKDLVGDDFRPGIFEPQPDNDPIDECDGHGTHVTGIIGADDQYFKGVAPQAILGVYKIYSCRNRRSSGTDSATVIAALIAAYEDGVDIINMSLSGESQWPDYATSAVASNLAKKGIIVVASGGNNQNEGVFATSAPSVGKDVISVASIDNIRYISKTFIINSSEESKFDYIEPQAIPFRFKDQELVHPTDSQNTDLACSDISSDLSGKIALVKNGDCSFSAKANNVQNAGARGLIIYNDVRGLLKTNIYDPSVNIPVIGVDKSVGEQLISELSKGPVKITSQSELSYSINPTGNTPSQFTSWGPDARLNVKPDVAGPGGMIFSTYPLALGGYTILSGTSMSTPYVAGCAALWLQYQKAKGAGSRSYETVLQFATSLSNLSKPTFDLDTKELLPTILQGAGLINIYETLNSNVVLEPRKISFFDSKGRNPLSASFTIKNNSREQLSCTLSHENARSVKGYSAEDILSIPESTQGKSNVRFVPPYVSLQPGQQTKVQTIISLDENLADDDHWIYSGFIKVESTSSSKQSYRIPYMGMKGDLSTLPVLPQPSKPNYPRIITDGFAPITETTEIDFSKGSFVFLNFGLLYPTGAIRLELYDDRNLLIGEAANTSLSYLGRSIPIGSYEVVAWKGSYIPVGKNSIEKIPSGKYSLMLKVLKPFGNPLNDDEFVTWQSVFFSCTTPI